MDTNFKYTIFRPTLNLNQMEIEYTNVRYRSLDTGHRVIENKSTGEWTDVVTKRKVPTYRVHKYISLTSKPI